MSLSKILQHVNSKGKLPQKAQNNNSLKNNETKKSDSNVITYKDGQNRVVDPVVAKLKEKRRLENEKKLQDAREKKGLLPKKTVTKHRSTSSSAPAKTGAKFKTITTERQVPAKSASRPKLKFNDLMKKASKIDQSKLSISIKSKSKSPESVAASKTHSQRATPHTGDKGRVNSYTSVASPEKSSQKPHNAPARGPIPVRKPSSSLQEKLSKIKQKQSHKHHRSTASQASAGESYDEDEDDEDLNSFVVSDEELEAGEEPVDYDKDEIWAIFNRGKKRSHYDFQDYDSADDMEATGAEILDEEMRSKRTAVLEDLKEMEEEKRLAALKKAKKIRRQ